MPSSAPKRSAGGGGGGGAPAAGGAVPAHGIEGGALQPPHIAARALGLVQTADASEAKSLGCSGVTAQA